MADTSGSGKAAVAATFNAASDHFDVGPLAFWDHIGRRTIERLAPSAGWSVLDAGCGSGASALPAAAAVGPTGAVIGVDLAEKLLELGRQKAAARGLENLTFRVGDMTDLDFPPARFDAVVSVFAIFFADDMAGHVAQLWRLVRPGGRLAITVWGPRMFEPGASVWWDTVRQEKPALCLPEYPWNRITEPAALRRILSDGGVGDADIAAEEGRQPLETPDDWWRVVLGTGLRGIFDKLSPEAAERVRDTNLRWARECALAAIETNTIYAVAGKPQSQQGRSA